MILYNKRQTKILQFLIRKEYSWVQTIENEEFRKEINWGLNVLESSRYFCVSNTLYFSTQMLITFFEMLITL